MITIIAAAFGKMVFTGIALCTGFEGGRGLISLVRQLSAYMKRKASEVVYLILRALVRARYEMSNAEYKTFEAASLA